MKLSLGMPWLRSAVSRWAKPEVGSRLGKKARDGCIANTRQQSLDMRRRHGINWIHESPLLTNCPASYNESRWLLRV
jgi:hypothetical protein